MSDELSERKIIEALSGALMPGTDQSIIDAGNVSGIVIRDSHVGFTIEIDPKDKDRVDALRVAAEKAVLTIDGVVSATAIITAHQVGPTVNTNSDELGTAIGAGKQMHVEPHQPASHVIAVASGNAPSKP